ncbi:trypsin-like peptidase domain-containing protein [Saccharopolyspora sp. MS10]|uniref:nSTAND1 domain-containing NTPase n=1 Tax=Saccharopolyspora sp. MS10 TaxID=3385973 RepID=UPI00399F8284
MTGSGRGTGVLDAAVLRVFDAAGRAVGLGFLVADGLALTCAHVVPGGGVVPLGRAVEVDLPLLRPDARVAARVELWVPAQVAAGDVAVLRIEGELPGARPVRLIDADELREHPARIFGLPERSPGGAWHHVVLRHRRGDGWVRADLTGRSFAVAPGFSGGPVWDDELSGVVGMMAMAEAGDSPVSYLLPTSGLLAVWPELAEFALPPSPFRGLRPFRESDAALFHGRRDESAEVARAVAAHRWTALVGPPGCGKSSLALAGVAPLVREDGGCPVAMRPGGAATPLRALASALLPVLEPGLGETGRPAETTALAGVLAGQGLSGVAARVLEVQRRERLLIVVDQFEELLTRSPDEIDELVRVLFDARAPDEVRVLCTLRSDLVTLVLAHPRLRPVASARVRELEPVRPERLREVISRPVADSPGVDYEPDLAERIRTDAGADPGALPLLGVALDLLWEHQERGVLTHRRYEELGGVAGALGRYAGSAWHDHVPEADEAAAERLLARLVRAPRGAAATRRIARREELGEREWAIARRLAATRLLVLRGGEPPDGVELAHEVLISGWGRLADRIHQDRSFRDWRDSLRRALDRWERAGRPPDLLPTGGALAAARCWLPARERELGDAEREFLRRARAHRSALTRRRRILVSALLLVLVLALLLAAASLVRAGDDRGGAAAAPAPPVATAPGGAPSARPPDPRRA